MGSGEAAGWAQALMISVEMRRTMNIVNLVVGIFSPV